MEEKPEIEKVNEQNNNEQLNNSNQNNQNEEIRKEDTNKNQEKPSRTPILNAVYKVLYEGKRASIVFSELTGELD